MISTAKREKPWACGTAYILANGKEICLVKIFLVMWEGVHDCDVHSAVPGRRLDSYQQMPESRG